MQQADQRRAKAPRNRSRPFTRYLLLFTILAAGVRPPAEAQEERWDLGLRLNLMGGSGKPTNDVLGYGAFGHYRLSGRWAIGFGIDRSEFDIERSAQLVGLVQDPAVGDIDNTADSTTLKVWIERSYRHDRHDRHGRRLQWHWLAGMGLADINVANAVGPLALADGGRFEVAVDIGSEPLLELGVGLRYNFSRRFYADATLRLEQHFADWELIDLESGAVGAIDDYTLRGIHLAIAYRF